MKLRKGRKRVCSVGDKYGKLTIVSLHGKAGLGTLLWECLCECGKVTVVRQGNLRTGHTTSCGCIKSLGFVTTNPGHAGCQKLFNNYKNSAKKRNLIFNLTKDEFSELVIKPCTYCGTSPERVSSVKVNSKKSEQNSRFLYNGIDRIDSSVGYSIENCTPCCYTCNVAKFEQSQQKFYEWVVKIFNNLKNKNLIN